MSKPMTANQKKTFAKNFFADGDQDDPTGSRVVGRFMPLISELLDELSTKGSMTVKQKMAFAKAYLKNGAKGNPILLSILAIFLPKILEMLESLFNREAA